MSPSSPHLSASLDCLKHQCLIALLISLLTGPTACLAAEEVSREVDENGVPSFSDQNTPGAEKIEVKEPMTFDSKVFVPEDYEYKPKSAPETGKSYQAEIVSPANGDAIRENSGALTINVSIKPVLSPGHKAELLMDGQSIRELVSGGPIELSNIDRGTHSFIVQITNSNGAVLESSPAVSVTLLRHSRN